MAHNNTHFGPHQPQQGFMEKLLSGLQQPGRAQQLGSLGMMLLSAGQGGGPPRRRFGPQEMEMYRHGMNAPYQAQQRGLKQMLMQAQITNAENKATKFPAEQRSEELKQRLALAQIQKAQRPPEQWSTVKDPYGRGGAGQQSSTSGKIEGYQGPKQTRPQVETFYDEKTGLPFKSIHNPLTGKWDRQGGQKTPTAGMDIYGWEDGKPLISMGNKPQNTNRRTERDINKKQLGLADRLQGLRNMQRDYLPKYQKIGTRWDMLKTEWAEKGGLDVDPANKDALEDFTIFKASAGENHAKLVADMAGTAVSKEEGRRQEVYSPKAGEGLFDGDSPTVMKTKMDRMESFVESAMMRLDMVGKKGLDIEVLAKDIPLSARNPITKKRVWFSQFMKVMKRENPGASTKQLLDLWKSKYVRK